MPIEKSKDYIKNNILTLSRDEIWDYLQKNHPIMTQAIKAYERQLSEERQLYPSRIH